MRTKPAFGISPRAPAIELPSAERSRALRGIEAAPATALVFLWLNGQQLDVGEDELTELAMGVASGQLRKAELGVFIGDHSRPAD